MSEVGNQGQVVLMVVIWLLIVTGCKPAGSGSVEWPDRRPIGVLFLARDNTGWDRNPRGWFNNEHLDVTTTAGRQEFRQWLLAYADRSVHLLRKINAQGIIVWDLEGEEFPHPNPTYVGNPPMLNRVAPEMDDVADEFFQRFSANALRVGVLLRPQHLEVKEPNRYEQKEYYFNSTAIYNELDRKIAYARKRWNCTLFYIDSNFGFWNFGLYDAGIFERLHQKHPDVLLIPEFANASYFQFCAPYYDPTLMEKWPDTRTVAWNHYSNLPKAFSAIYTGNADLAQMHEKIVNAVRHGSILMTRGWMDGPEMEEVRRIYAEATTSQN
jgi:hypothetical protein